MVNRPAILPIERIEINIYAEDLSFLRRKFGRRESTETGRLGYGPAIREIVHAAVKRLRHVERTRIDQTSHPQQMEPNDALNTQEPSPS